MFEFACLGAEVLEACSNTLLENAFQPAKPCFFFRMSILLDFAPVHLTFLAGLDVEIICLVV